MGLGQNRSHRRGVILAAVFALMLTGGCTGVVLESSRKIVGVERRTEAIEGLVRTQRLMEENKYDDALAEAYKALKTSRDLENGVLEHFTSQIIGSIHLLRGNRLAGARMFVDSQVKLYGMFGSSNVYEVYREILLLTMVDLAMADDLYLFTYLESVPLESNPALAVLRKTMELAKKTKEPVALGDAPPSAREKLSSGVRLLQAMAQAQSRRDARRFADAVSGVFDLFLELEGTQESKLSIPQEARRAMKLSVAWLDAVVRKDRTAAVASVSQLIEFQDEMSKKEEVPRGDIAKECCCQFG